MWRAVKMSSAFLRFLETLCRGEGMEWVSGLKRRHGRQGSVAKGHQATGHRPSRPWPYDVLTTAFLTTLEIGIHVLWFFHCCRKW